MALPWRRKKSNLMADLHSPKRSSSNRVLPPILTMLALLALASTVHSLTFGLTISAFLLLFLHFALQHLPNPPSASFHNLLSVLQPQLSSASHEIEVLGPTGQPGTGNSPGDICSLGSQLNPLHEDKKGAASEIENDKACEITQDKTKCKRGAKLRSKIAKRLRGLRKKNRTKDREEIDKEKEPPSSVEGDESAISEIEQEGIKAREGWSEVDFGITGSHQEVEEDESNVQKQQQEQERIDRGGSSVSGALILFIVALAGLVMGRFPAFLLALTWMSVLKILVTRRKSLNVHLVRCCEQISS